MTGGFKAYIRQRRVTDTPAGDFIGDAKRDPDFPTVRCWGDLATYLLNRNACNGAIHAAWQVWSEYRKETTA